MKEVIIKIIFTVLPLTFLLNACSTTTFQTANTVPKGDYSLSLSMTTPVESDDVDYSNRGDPSEAETIADLWIPQLSFRTGIGENTDLGAGLFGAGLMFDIKYAFFQNRDFGPSLAVIGGVGLSYGTIFGVTGGFIFSMKFYNILAPYTALRYWFFTGGGSGVSIKGGSTNLIFATFGTEIFPGETVSFALEGSKFFAPFNGNLNESEDTEYFFSAGIKFNF
ncbi:MAG: hypothetical protein GY754_18980 [bacterium]|nr:hypothetical protein [bacterium]